MLGSLIEAAVLAGVVYYAWTWPKASGAVTASSAQSQPGTRVGSAPKVLRG